MRRVHNAGSPGLPAYGNVALCITGLSFHYAACDI